jgi:hypothetical protein
MIENDFLTFAEPSKRSRCSLDRTHGAPPLTMLSAADPAELHDAADALHRTADAAEAREDLG